MPTRFALDINGLVADRTSDLSHLALAIARAEAPQLDAGCTLAELARIGDRAARALGDSGAQSVQDRLAILNHVVFDQEGFSPNTDHYDDVRNHLLHVVVETRMGVPITLATVYVTVARLAGLEVFGVSFPGHFLMRVPRDAGDDRRDPLVLDPFDGGRELSADALRTLLETNAGADAVWNEALLAPATSRQIAVRMLNNLKRVYVGMRSFHQAWLVADALVTLEGRDPELVRDRGLLAYHLDDFPAALADLEEYVQVSRTAREGNEERGQIWEHLSALRRRLASMN